MKKNQLGEIATILTLGTLIIIGLSSLASSIFLKNRQTTRTKAQIACENEWYCAGECLSDQAARDSFAGIYGDAGAAFGWRREKAQSCGIQESQCSSATVCAPIGQPTLPPPPAGTSCDSQWYCGGECANQAVRDTFGDPSKWRQEKANNCGFNVSQCSTITNCMTNAPTVTPTSGPTPTPLVQSCLPGRCCQMDEVSRKIVSNSWGQVCSNTNNCDAKGGCNPNCCAVKDDCPYGFAGQTCGEKDGKDNGYCQTNKSCDWWSDYSERSKITPTPPIGDPCGKKGGRYYQECCANGFEAHVCQVGDNWYCDYGDGTFDTPCQTKSNIGCVFPNSKCQGPTREPLPPEKGTPTPKPQVITTPVPATENCTITYTNDCTNRGKSAVLCTNGKYRCGDSSTALAARPGAITPTPTPLPGATTPTPAAVSTNRCPDNGKDVSCTFRGCGSGYTPINLPCINFWDVCCVRQDTEKKELLTPIPKLTPYTIQIDYELGSNPAAQAIKLSNLRSLHVCDYYGSNLGAGDIRNCVKIPEKNMKQEGATEKVTVEVKPNQKQVVCQIFIYAIPNNCHFIN